ncbi:MAG: phosphotransferase family protein [Flammeovirgaceae bacterium]
MSNTAIDQATEVRKGEELQEAQLRAYISNQLGIATTAFHIKQFGGGFSNLTYLVQAGDTEMVLRRPPFGANIATAHDMEREFKVLSMLKGHYSKIPNPVAYCDDLAVIGSPFYLMERAKGVILRGQVPKGITLSPEVMKDLSEATVDNLVDLHAIDLQESGLIELGKPEGYVKRQVEGWIKRYYNAQTDEIKEMDELAEWLRENQYESGQTSLIHNDYKYDNIVLNPKDLTDIIAVLDWEMTTIGDPLMDLGTSLAYWCEESDNPIFRQFNLSWIPGNLTRAGIVARYAEKTGIDVDHILFNYVFGLFKLAVIGQQIYARFKKGFTKDPRFAMLIMLVKGCAARGALAVESGKLSHGK